MDALTWSLLTDGDWLTIDPTEGYLNGTPGNEDVGLYWVNITVGDGNGGVDWSNFTLEVVNVNDPPSILTIDVTTAIEDELYTVMYGAIDMDPTNDTLIWSLDTDAGWLSFDPETSILWGTPTNDDVGSYFVNMTISDGNGGAAWSYFTLTVEGTNDAPVWNEDIPDKENPSEEPFSLKVSVDDVDGSDEITFGLSTDPASGMVIDPQTGEISWVEPVPGTYLVNVSASDGVYTIYQEFQIVFTEEPGDEPSDEGIPWLPIVIIIVVVLLVLLLLFLLLRKKKETPEETDVPEE
jgi:hypothetical protein